jgi:hypothetical protein
MGEWILPPLQGAGIQEAERSSALHHGVTLGWDGSSLRAAGSLRRFCVAIPVWQPEKNAIAPLPWGVISFAPTRPRARWGADFPTACAIGYDLSPGLRAVREPPLRRVRKTRRKTGAGESGPRPEVGSLRGPGSNSGIRVLAVGVREGRFRVPSPESRAPCPESESQFPSPVPTPTEALQLFWGCSILALRCSEPTPTRLHTLVTGFGASLQAGRVALV